MPKQKRLNGADVLSAFQSKAEAELALHFRAEGLEPEVEFRFHPTRRWRFDFAFPLKGLAVEVEGITHGGGRHQRAAGFEEDCRKYAAAMVLGWRVLRVTPRMVQTGEAIGLILALLNGEQLCGDIVPGTKTARLFNCKGGKIERTQKTKDDKKGLPTKNEIDAAIRKLGRRTT